MLIAGRNTPLRDGDQVSLLIAGASKIFGGGMVMINATGFAVKGQTAANLTYVGRAEETVDNLAGADGAKTVQVKRHKAFKWGNSSADPITQADLFKTAYVVDDETVSKTSGTNTRSVAGKIIGVDADGVWIE
jgi:hypothetical protein